MLEKSASDDMLRGPGASSARNRNMVTIVDDDADAATSQKSGGCCSS